MTTPYKLPLRVVKSGESVRIEDADGRSVYLYFENTALRRNLMKRWTEEEAVALGQQIARALTDAAS